MTTDAAIVSRIFELTRGDLATATFPRPDPASLLAGHETVRVTRLSRFWQTPERETNALLEHTIALLAAFHAQGVGFAFAIRGNKGDVECWIGARGAHSGRDSVAAMVRGAIPDSRIDASRSLLERLELLPHGIVLTGMPSVRSDSGRPLDQIESVVRSLMGRGWIYLVVASPRDAPLVARDINQLAGEIRDIRATRLLDSNPMAASDRTAERYVSLLETKLRRFEAGRVQGMWDAQVVLLADNPLTLGIGRGLLQSVFSGDASGPDPIRACACSSRPAPPARPLEPIGTRELAILSRLPQEEYPGYELVEATRYGVNTAAAASQGEVLLGNITDRGTATGKELRACLDDLATHLLIVGVTGSGKTTTCMDLLRQVWRRGSGIPFLVIESAKSEYRNLLGDPDLPSLRVFTVADETVAPLRLNPFEVPHGVLVQTHIDYVKSLFSAAFVLYPPMPYVLEQSIQEIYEDRGWDLARNENHRGISPRAFPRLTDLSRKIGEVVDRLGYDTRITMDVKAGLLARVNQLRLGGGKGLMLDCRESVGAGALFQSPCVIELKTLVSDDEKAFLIGLLLIRLYEHCETTRARGRLQHLTVIEEAHRLLRKTSIEQAADTANPRGRAVEVFTNMLSELRAYGEGIAIVEQIPAKLTPDAIKNTGTKLIHRIVAKDDRELVGASMNLTPDQIRGVALLRPGEMVAFTERLQKSVLVRASNAPPTLSVVSDKALREAMSQRDSTSAAACISCKRLGGQCTAAHIRCETGEVRASFRRLVNALRFAPAAAKDRADGVVRMLGAQNRSGWSPRCALAVLAEQECDARGAFFGWPFEEIDRAVDALMEDIESLVSHQRPSGSSAGLADRLYDRSDRSVLAFSACALCPRPCHYPFEVDGLAAEQEDFRSSFKDQSIPFAALMRIAYQAAGHALPHEAVAARREAAFCFTACQLHLLQLAPATQTSFASRAARELRLKE